MIRLPFRLRVRVATRSILTVLARPPYLILAVLGSFFFFQFLLWFYNLNLIFYILFVSDLPLTEKLLFPIRSFGALFIGYSGLQAATLLILSLIQGVLISVLVYVFRHRASAKKSASSGGLSLVAAVFGFGCATCGTSLLSPLLSFLAAGTAAAVATIIGPLINLISIILGLYALLQLAGPLSNELSQDKPLSHPNPNNI